MRNMKTIGVLVASLILPAAALNAAETFDSKTLHLKNVTGTVHVRTADVARISVDIDDGTGIVDAPTLSMRQGVVEISGQKMRRRNCRERGDKIYLGKSRFLGAFGLGRKYPLEDFPSITVTAPIGTFLEISGGQVFGESGDLGEADIQLNGCGKFSIGDVAGNLDVQVNGPGDFVSGDVGGALDALVNGVGDLVVGDVKGEVEAEVNGVGDMTIASVNGRVYAHVNGVGDIDIEAGTATPFIARVNGVGDVSFEGHAIGVDAQVHGVGGISIGSYEGSFNTSRRGVHVQNNNRAGGGR